jgi:hypothetical protein
MSGRRAKHVALGVACCVYAAILLSSSSTSTSRQVTVLEQLQEMDAKLTRIEQSIGEYDHN